MAPDLGPDAAAGGLAAERDSTRRCRTRCPSRGRELEHSSGLDCQKMQLAGSRCRRIAPAARSSALE